MNVRNNGMYDVMILCKQIPTNDSSLKQTYLSWMCEGRGPLNKSSWR